MYRYFPLLLISFSCCFMSCNQEPQFSEEYKLQVMHQVLQYAHVNGLIDLPHTIILEEEIFPPLDPYYYDEETDSYTKETSQIKLITKHLKAHDTLFISKQRKANAYLNLKLLSQYGYKVTSHGKIDQKTLLETEVLCISKPIFSRDGKKVFIRLSYSGVSGGAFIFYKKNGKWSSYKQITNWVV